MPAEVLINQRQQFAGGLGVALLQRAENLEDVVYCLAVANGPGRVSIRCEERGSVYGSFRGSALSKPRRNEASNAFKSLRSSAAVSSHSPGNTRLFSNPSASGVNS